MAWSIKVLSIFLILEMQIKIQWRYHHLTEYLVSSKVYSNLMLEMYGREGNILTHIEWKMKLMIIYRWYEGVHKNWNKDII